MGKPPILQEMHTTNTPSQQTVEHQTLSHVERLKGRHGKRVSHKYHFTTNEKQPQLKVSPETSKH